MANDILTANGLAAVRTLLGRAVKGLGSTGSVSITYKRQTAESYDPTAANANSPTTSDKSLTAGLLERTAKDEPAVRGRLIFLVLVSDFESAYSSGVKPSNGDQITYSSTTYEVDHWAEDPLAALFTITCERVGS